MRGVNVKRWGAVLIFAAATAACGDAADREVMRFRRLLGGRHDAARAAAMRSIPADFQSRLAVLPVVIQALQQLADEPRFERAAERHAPDLPGGVRAMIDFVGAVDRPEATDALVSLLDCGRQSWAMAAIETLCRHQHQAALDSVIAQMDAPWFQSNYGFRFVLARGLRNMKHPDAWEALAALYDRVDGQLAHRLRQEFAGVTADNFGGDEKRFQIWCGFVGMSPEAKPGIQNSLERAANLLAESNPDGDTPLPKEMDLGPTASAASYVRRKHLKPSHYYGIDIFAKRLLFVLDRSGSMDTMVSGQTRIARAKRELIAAISGLDEQCEFGVLVFDSGVRAWREELVPATASNKRGAVRFVQYLSAGSTTNTYAALRTALEFDDQLEAVFLLTDGQPTTGQIVNPAAILLDVLKRNEIHNVTLNTVAVAVEPLMANFLRNLTEPSNGEYRELN